MNVYDIEAHRHFAQGRHLMEQGRYQESIDLFTQALVAGEQADLHGLYLSRGTALLMVKDYLSAVYDFSKILKYNANSKRARFYRGMAYKQMGRHDKAVDDFSSAIHLDPHYGIAYLQRGISHQALNHERRADRDLRAALALSASAKQQFQNELGMVQTQSMQAEAQFHGDAKPSTVYLTEGEMAEVRAQLS